MPASNEAIGVGEAQYAGPEDGPFACHNCGAHYKWPHLCDHPKVIADAKAGRTNRKGYPRLQKTGRGLAIIEPGGCCRYFRD